MKTFTRSLSLSTRLLKEVKPAVPLTNASQGKDYETFSKNFPVKKKAKAWELAGEDKETFFKTRYAHLHAKQKANDRAERRDHYKQVRRERKKNEYSEFKTQRQQHKQRYGRDIYKTLTPNPLSEYIYGTSTVLAALQANKRELFSNLFIYNPDDDQKTQSIIKLAAKLGINVDMVDSRSHLNSLTNNAIHNGVVLETKPLFPSPLYHLGEVIGQDFLVSEDNFGSVIEQTYKSKNVNPLGIYLDGISDPHNVGAIIRSAYFLGADFVVLSERNCSKLTPTVAKTSVGAMELMPIMTCEKPLKFFDKSREHGWSFISAGVSEHHRDDKITSSLKQKTIEFDELRGLLEAGPCVLVLGSEGEGIRTTLKTRSDFLVEIKASKGVSPLVDSLNVSVAAALLMEKLLQK